MTRKLRTFVEGLPVHVVQRGVNKCDIFANDQDCSKYLDVLVEAADKHGCPVHCYALMGNHVHLLMTPAHQESLSKTMQSVNVRYVWHFNHRHERTGPLFESRYRDSLVATDRYLQACYQYIELNPVRAGLCKRPNDYRWSSHRHHAYGEPDPVITRHHAYLALASDDTGRQSRYRGWFRQELNDEQLEQIRSGV